MERLQTYNTFLFDWDGTVAQTLSAWLPIVRHTLESYDIVLDDKEIVRRVFGSARSGLLHLGVPEADLPEVFAQWDRTATVNMPLVPLYDGVTDVFDVLKQQGKKLAVVTATIRPVMEVVLKTHGLDHTIDVLVTGSDIQEHKPNPEGLLRAMTQLHADPARTVMLGDSEKDIRAAHNAAVDSVLFFPAEHEQFHALAELQADRPTYVIHAWQELLNQLQ